MGMVNSGLQFMRIGAFFVIIVLCLKENAIGFLGLCAQGASGVLMAITVVTVGVSMSLAGT